VAKTIVITVKYYTQSFHIADVTSTVLCGWLFSVDTDR